MSIYLNALKNCHLCHRVIDPSRGIYSTLLNCPKQCCISICKACVQSAICKSKKTYDGGFTCPECKEVSRFSLMDIAHAKTEEEKLIEEAIRCMHEQSGGRSKNRRSPSKPQTKTYPCKKLVEYFTVHHNFGRVFNGFCDEIDTDKPSPQLRLAFARCQALALTGAKLQTVRGSIENLPLGPVTKIKIWPNLVADRLISGSYKGAAECAWCHEEIRQNKTVFMFCTGGSSCDICRDCLCDSIRSSGRLNKMFSCTVCKNSGGKTNFGDVDEARAHQRKLLSIGLGSLKDTDDNILIALEQVKEIKDYND